MLELIIKSPGRQLGLTCIYKKAQNKSGLNNFFQFQKLA